MIDEELRGQMVNWRRQLHRHPETAFEEVATARMVAKTLRELGCEVHEGLGQTGVVGTLRRGAGRSIGLRADMDALPIAEFNSFEHRSEVKGKMHACGHDGHTAMLLGGAALLSRDSGWRGTVHFIFQPAEEVAGGGKVMMEDGLFERFECEAVFGLHNWPGLPLGRFALNDGPMMASFDTFELLVDGNGSHAAMPEEGIDALVCASHIVIGLQTIVSRRLSPKEAAVISVTQIHGGEAWNVLPDRVVIRGTVRCFSADIQQRIIELLGEISESTARAHGAIAALSYHYGYPATINAASAAGVAAAAARATVGSDSVTVGIMPSMASEDFAFMAESRPAAYVWMGVDGKTPGAPLHNPHYDFNDDALSIGASYWLNLVKTFGEYS
ncbi:amidohydrolase family protein [Paraburkholderia xenovorans LB400]|uniref:Peptidase M20D, amidohydrolase n=1 Tax=Paraburkholderia xenovorans (strain LB400) TaxID=266265 RepID=Q13J80_PARXL|nr:M20 aminoacylase family protein [Paraburkholderia xenovorans]ABE35859.1 Peptidase M20D, amidohydrolase [Paraburkholderia xenovorans LB400]AIP37159.1 amidohydrolase family protein [Paraburkholderia xenovorans LB400]